jgi:hypothetical protein
MLWAIVSPEALPYVINAGNIDAATPPCDQVWEDIRPHMTDSAIEDYYEVKKAKCRPPTPLQNVVVEM